MQSKRINHLDLVAGLLILWMIYFDHLRSFCGVSYFIGYDALKRLFYFFMSWFFFKSGMFYDEKRNARDVAMRDFHRFVVPFLIGCLIAMAIQALYLSLTDRRWSAVRSDFLTICIRTQFSVKLQLGFLH